MVHAAWAGCVVITKGEVGHFVRHGEAMLKNRWYVIQTKSGDEAELKTFMESICPTELVVRFFIPLYENVWRSGGRGHISMNRLFPGYVFAETDEPKKLFAMLKTVPRFTRLLNMEGEDHEKVFLPVSEADEAFLRSLMDEDYVIRVSYIHKDKSGRIDRLIGPLKTYESRITKLDVPHRRAIVQTYIFGKERTIKFGLWTDSDPVIPRLRYIKQQEATSEELDIGIYEGDLVRDKSGIYEGLELTVVAVDAKHRTVKVCTELFGCHVTIEMDAETVEVIEK